MERRKLQLDSIEGCQPIVPGAGCQYAIANCIYDESAIAKWVHDVLKKHDHITAKVKSKYWQQMHKFGINPQGSRGRAAL
jgi:hypothetical protein